MRLTGVAETVAFRVLVFGANRFWFRSPFWLSRTESAQKLSFVEPELSSRPRRREAKLLENSVAEFKYFIFNHILSNIIRVRLNSWPRFAAFLSFSEELEKFLFSRQYKVPTAKTWSSKQTSSPCNYCTRAMASPIVFLSTLFFLLGSTLARSIPSSITPELSLIHRDSANSPLKRNWTSGMERMRSNAANARNRAKHVHARITQASRLQPADDTNPDIVVENGVKSYGEYLLKVFISSKNQEQWLIYDTGSDLLWVQCKNCNPCFKQPNQAFDVANSSSAYVIPCSECSSDALSNLSTHCSSSRCTFEYSYVDQSKLIGTLAKETFDFGDQTTFEDVIFGCATSSNMKDEPDGLAGFSMGATSLPNQLSQHLGRKAFSTCLVRNELNVDNKLVMGANAVAPSGISYTPLVNPDGSGNPPSFFNVEVTKVLVGNAVIKIPSSAFTTGSGTIVDSGTTLIVLNKAALDPILKAIARVTKKLSAVSVDGALLCYKLRLNSQSKLNSHFPRITFVLKNNVNVKLFAYHYMNILDETTVCSAFAYSGDDATNLLGGYFQQDFLVVHDVEGSRLGFKPMNCASGKPR